MIMHKILSMLALEMHLEFGSVSHVQFRNNFINLRFYPKLNELVFDSYTNAQVKDFILNGATDPIDIKPGVK
jgi:hypothetical protein